MIKKLLSIRLLGVFASASGQSKKNKKRDVSIGKIALFAFLYLYLALALLFLSVSISASLAAVFAKSHGWLYFGLMSAATFTILFVLSIFETKAELFDCKDNELLLSMPIKPSDIVLSRISSVLIYNYIADFIIMIPAIVLYGIFSGYAIGIIGGVAVMLILPFPATALAAGVGYLLALLTKKTRNNTFITVLLSLLFLGAYFLVYGELISGLESLEDLEAFEALFDIEALTPLRLLGDVAMLKPLNLLVFVLVSAVVSASVYLVISKNYLSIITYNPGKKRTKYKADSTQTHSSVYALVLKELSKFFSSATYIMNGGIGAIMRVGIGIFALFSIGEARMLISELTYALPGISYDGVGLMALTVAALLLPSMDMISVSSVSLEGKNLWILKSMPLKPSEVLLSKTLAHIVLCAPASALSTLLIAIAFGIGALPTALGIIISVAVTVLYAVFGTVINVAFPKFIYDNEAQVIKQSLASTIVIFSQMLFAILMLVPVIMLGIIFGGYVAAVFSLLIISVLAAILFVIMYNVSSRRFANF